MYINASKITVSELEEELNKRNMKIVAADGNISSIQQEDSNVQTTQRN